MRRSTIVRMIVIAAVVLAVAVLAGIDGVHLVVLTVAVLAVGGSYLLAEHTGADVGEPDPLPRQAPYLVAARSFSLTGSSAQQPIGTYAGGLMALITSQALADHPGDPVITAMAERYADGWRYCTEREATAILNRIDRLSATGSVPPSDRGAR